MRLKIRKVSYSRSPPHPHHYIHGDKHNTLLIHYRHVFITHVRLARRLCNRQSSKQSPTSLILTSCSHRISTCVAVALLVLSGAKRPMMKVAPAASRSRAARHCSERERGCAAKFDRAVRGALAPFLSSPSSPSFSPRHCLDCALQVCTLQQ